MVLAPDNCMQSRALLLAAVLTLGAGPAWSADVSLSREISAHGDDLTTRLDSAVADMKRELQSQGCGRIVVAYWSESVPLKRLRVEVRCRDGEKDEALAALPIEVAR